jgi:L-rhamnose mutarotase
MVIGVVPETIAEYRKLHAAVWPEVLELLQRHHIQNYSIFLKDETLFGYLEYTGDDFEGDFKRLGDYEAMQRWYAVCSPCQKPLPTREKGEWWALMDQVFLME